MIRIGTLNEDRRVKIDRPSSDPSLDVLVVDPMPESIHLVLLDGLVPSSYKAEKLPLHFIVDCFSNLSQIC